MSVDVDPAELLFVALRAARTAGAELLQRQRARLDGDVLAVETKSSRTDPVSEADRAAERAILATILRWRPDDGVVGEEDQGDRPGTTGLRWLVDPLDGTVNFLHHQPQWSVSIAVADAAGPLVGVVHHPSLHETFHAVRGAGAWQAQRRLTVVDPPSLDEALLTTGFAYDQQLRPGQFDALGRWARQVRYVRRLGSAALDLAWVAAGRGHVYLEAGLNEWDWSAGSLLVTEAGGRVSWHDVAYGATTRATILAAGPRTHDLVVERLLSR